MKRRATTINRRRWGRIEELERRVLLTVTPVGEVINLPGFGSFHGQQPMAVDASGRFALIGDAVVRFYSLTGAFVDEAARSQCSLNGVAASLDGGFLVFCNTNISPPAVSQHDVIAQWFDPIGNAMGSEFIANKIVAGIQSWASASADASGDFTLIWRQNGPIFGRRIHPNGTGTLDTLLISTGLTSGPSLITTGAAGDFAVSYEDGIAFFDRDGDHVNTVSIDLETAYAVSKAPGGELLLVRNNGSGGITGDLYDVNGIRIDGRRVAVQEITSRLGLTALPDGRFLLGYNRNGRLYVQEIDASGVPIGEPVDVGNQAWDGIYLGAGRNGEALLLAVDSQFVTRGIRLLVDELPITTIPTHLRVTGDTTYLLEGVRLVQSPQSMSLEFVGLVSADGGPSGEHSALNPANWRLTRNGEDISALIASIAVEPRPEGYGDRAVVTFTEPLPTGNFVLTAKEAIHNPDGLMIDGDQDGLEGGDFSSSFTVLLPVASGGEFRVNQHTAGNQRTSPSSLANTAMRSDGVFVTTWASDGQDGSGWGVYARLFNTQGQPMFNEFPVNQTTTGHQRFSTVAMDQEGDFVITWSSDGQDGDGYGVYARRFTAAGHALGNEFKVNGFTTDSQLKSSIAMEDNGDFIVAWESRGQDGFGYGVYARRFNAAGNASAPEFLVNQTVASDQRLAIVAMDPDGDFVVTWSSFGQDGSGYGVYARRYDAAGNALGNEFRVNTTTPSTQQFAQIAMDRTGEFLVAWMSNGQDGDGYGIYAQRYNAAGEAQGEEFRVNTTTAGNQQYPVVARDDDGDTVIAWASQQQDGDSWGVYARRYSPSGVPQGDEFRVNTTTAGQQNLPSVAIDADGDFVVIWNSEGQDGDGFGIYAQRYSANAGPTADAGGPYAITEGDSLQLSATASSDPDQGDTLTYSWDVNGDGVFGDAVGITPLLTWAQLQALAINDGPATISNLRVRATDTVGNVDESDDAALTVQDRAPTIALAGAATVNEGAAFTLTLGAITDPGADTVSSWLVHWGDGSSDTYVSGGNKSHVYADGPAARTITVDLVDEDGLHENAGSRTLNVTNVAPLLSALSAPTIDENGMAMLSGTITDPSSADDFTLTVSWGDGSPAQVVSLPAGTTSFQVAHQYFDDPAGPPPDQYPIDVILRDDDNGQDTDSLRVMVNNVAPEVVIQGAQASNPVDDPVNLTAVVTDPGTLDTFTYAWSVERDGVLFASGNQPNFSFAPDADANYVVRLTVTDDDAGTGQASVTVRVPGGTILGDTDGNGTVDLEDLNNVRNNFGGTGLGDTDGNGTVDLEDLNNVRNNFGASVEIATSTTTDVPAIRDHDPAKNDVHSQRKASDAVFARLAGDDTDQESGPNVSGLFDELYGARARARRMLWRLR